MFDLLLDAVKDSVKLLPFLFLTYLVMELLEHGTGKGINGRIKKAGKFGPLWGGVLGVVPQCGFSTAASSLYAGRVITVGTLLAVYLSTSDEMLPVLLAESVQIDTIIKIIVCKAVIAIISGFLAEAFYTGILRKKEREMDIHTVCEEENCHCEDGVLLSAVKHTGKIFLYILLLSFALNAVIGAVGEERLAGLFLGVPVVGELVSALIGLIPNCASSVIITELYLSGVISPGAMLSGLLVNAGVGIPVLFRLNRNWKQNAGIIAALYGIGVFWGLLAELAGVVF